MARARPDYDHVVVGAGAAGCVVTAPLSEDLDTRVLVLEAGPDAVLDDEVIPLLAGALRTSDANWAYRTVPQTQLGRRRIEVAAGRGVGGGGRINCLLWLRGDPADYDAWHTDHGMTGWDWNTVSASFPDAGGIRGHRSTDPPTHEGRTA